MTLRTKGADNDDGGSGADNTETAEKGADGNGDKEEDMFNKRTERDVKKRIDETNSRRSGYSNATGFRFKRTGLLVV
ncbi:hypothetical protein V6N11_054969 [Hibiscus sabdariffa]|uniref:Uncharacterized protein n=1 Tax=Hibiscus sabdariffa TaxID=183260 RepID=A0ABR2P3K4_9ROSI